MLIMIDDREIVAVGYAGGFKSEGVCSTGFCPTDFRGWVETVSEHDLGAVEAFLIGNCRDRMNYPGWIRERSDAPIIAINETQSLDQTLDLFAAGFDDVVRKPIHVRELLARIDAIRRRAAAGAAKKDDVAVGDIRVFFDGRDPEICGEAFLLPRRERRILEYLVKNRGRRVSKTQIFNAIYGIFDENIEENVVESHVSKLRKKLRAKLGYDPIESKRYLGYCLEDPLRRGACRRLGRRHGFGQPDRVGQRGLNAGPPMGREAGAPLDEPDVGVREAWLQTYAVPSSPCPSPSTSSAWGTPSSMSSPPWRTVSSPNGTSPRAA